MNKKLFCCLLAFAAVLSIVLVAAPNAQASTASPVCAMSAEGVAAGYDSVDAALAGATEGVTYYQLNADVTGGTISRDILLDLNGCELTGVTVGEGVTVRLMDSANDGYDAALCGQLSGTVNGIVETLVKTTVEETGAVKSYVVVSQDGSYCAHRYYAAITDISLEPAKAALGYKAQFAGDATVQAMVTGFGYELWANDYPARQFTKTGDLQELTLRLQNILVQGNDALNQLGSTATIGGRAIMTLDVNGQTLTVSSTAQETSLRQVIETIDAALGADRSAYTTAQVEAVRTLCTAYEDYMTGWATENIFADGTVDKFVSALPENDFIFRVGNRNAVSIDRLFSVIEGANVGTVTITAESAVDGVEASCTYDADTVQFSGTGPVTVTISDDRAATPFSVLVEVVDGYNVTAYKELGNRNSVLMNDITMSSGGSFSLTGATLYGNGFTFDVSDGAYSGSGYASGNYVIFLNSGKLDNVQIVGAVYTTYGGTAASDYNRAAVYSTGSSVIANSYVSNCAAPVRVNGGQLEIVNSTLKGGNFANLDIRNGNVTLDNVTTINQVNGNDTAEDGTIVVGLGIVVYYEQVLDTTTVEIRNGLTQYNHLSQTQVENYITDLSAQTLANAMFDTKYAALQYNDGTDTWVNSGIISMTYNVGDNNITDVDGYLEASPSLNGTTGYVHTKQPTAQTVTEQIPEYVSAGQYSIAPSYSFDFSEKNHMDKTEGSNDYCYYDSGVVYISMDEGDSFSWDTAILTATKLGQNLDYTVTMDGTDYTGKTIAFSQAGDYTVSYSYTDGYNYALDASGSMTAYEVTYTKTVHINVAVAASGAKDAEFTFGTEGLAGTKLIIGENTYVMPDVTETSETVGSLTVNGTTVYFPVVEAFSSDGLYTHGSSEYWAMCFPVFDTTVTITDYADGGVGDAVTYNSSTASMPSSLSVAAYSQYFKATSGVPGGGISFISGGADQAFKYQASASAADEPMVLDSGALAYQSPTLSNNGRDEMYLVVQYQYRSNMGTVHSYFVCYHMPQHTEKSCVTGDTLVTLADGSQKRVDTLTGQEQLLVWNHTTASYDTAPIAYIVNHDEQVGEHEVIHLYFSDGSDIEIIGEHVFFDADLNKYVALDDNAEQYIGHSFAVAASGYQGLTTAQLVKVEKEIRETGVYEVVTYKNITCFTDGILSASAYLDKLLNIFDVNPETMGYEPEAVQKDIETYGLYTYADFEGLIDEKAFELYNAAYLKIAVGKGYITWDDILQLIDIYFDVEVEPLTA